MTTAMQDVVAALNGDTAVSAMVGNRCYPNKAPQNGARPFIVLNVVSSIPENSFDGAAVNRIYNVHMQVDCYAATYDAAEQLGVAVDLVLSDLDDTDLSAWLDATREDYDDVAELHRVSHDISIWRSRR